MKKILLTRKMLDCDIQYISEKLDEQHKGQYCIVTPDDYSEDSIIKEVHNADVLLGPYITKKILEKADNLKLIQIPWTGMDTFDFSAVKNCKIPVCNTHSNATAVAELGVSLILDLVKKTSFHDRKMRQGSWNREQKPLTLKSGMMSDYRICIFGFGHIGNTVAKYLSTFGCEIDAVATHQRDNFPYHRLFLSGEIESAVKEADIIVLTLPLTDGTLNLVNASLIEKMKKGSMIVNLSRAQIVNEKAVYDGLECGKIGGFASDVWWKAPARGETLSSPSQLGLNFEKFENVIFSPHRAGFVEGKLPHLDGAIENISAVLDNSEIKNVVDIDHAY